MENSNDKGMAILAYILFFIPMIVSNNRSAFLNFHINQGFNVFVFGMIISVLSWFIPFVGLLSWATLIFIIIGIIGASKGEMKPLPIIGGMFSLVK